MGLHTRHYSKRKFAGFGLVAMFMVASCGNGDTGSSSGSNESTGSLSGICPETIVVQTDWFPESEHGALYQLMGDDYVVDVDKKTVKGSLIDSNGTDTGVDIEIRTGGPAIGYSPVSSTMATDPSITMGYVLTDDAAFGYDTIETLAVVAPLEINPQIIMWDPETYPDIETIADLGEAGITINAFGGASYLQVFIGEGVVSEGQVDESYDGSPARFIAEGGKIAQQGFASAEPYQYKNEFTDWGKDVSYQLIHDAGFEIYAAPLTIRAEEKDELSACLTEFVPLVQRAAIDFIENGSRAVAIIIDTVEKFNDFWVYSEGVANYSIATMKELGLVGNGSDTTLGNFDFDRANGVLDKMRAAGLDIPADLKAEDIYTNEFIDMTIGMK
jgi:hypothetical protein